jgi:predicted ester cyclase
MANPSFQRTRPLNSNVRPLILPTTMHDTPLDLAAIPWSPQKETVRLFYHEVWNRTNTSLVPTLFHPDFTFRGSLGPQLVGHTQFIGYVESVTAALGQYTCDILALTEERNQVFGKLRFHGFHQREMLGVPPTGRHVWWYGAPLFTFDGPLIRDLWVLGDIHGLRSRLAGEA